mmetsp:Transcript_17379/g.38460  ORF Transcript_17379/g.38460 Transcript_17379/m.38460 type:complete len:254 (+) Transcript_17379:1886-2647(+)
MVATGVLVFVGIVSIVVMASIGSIIAVVTVTILGVRVHIHVGVIATVAVVSRGVAVDLDMDVRGGVLITRRLTVPGVPLGRRDGWVWRWTGLQPFLVVGGRGLVGRIRGSRPGFAWLGGIWVWGGACLQPFSVVLSRGLIWRSCWVGHNSQLGLVILVRLVARNRVDSDFEGRTRDRVGGGWELGGCNYHWHGPVLGLRVRVVEVGRVRCHRLSVLPGVPVVSGLHLGPLLGLHMGLHLGQYDSRCWGFLVCQ